MTLVVVKCTKVIGLAPSVGLKSPNCLFSQTVTGRFIVGIATGLADAVALAIVDQDEDTKDKTKKPA
jgi:hypothetical protein